MPACAIGLTNQQFSLLMALNQPEPPSMAPVARLLAMDRTTLTAALKPLEKRGLVDLDPDPKDRRSRRLQLTQAGHAALLSALPVWRQAHADVEAAMPKFDMEELRAALLALA
jgi:DNA-binding MarR family transcriptional regulator